MNRARNLQQPTAAAKAVSKGQIPPSCAVVGESEVKKMKQLIEAPRQQAEAEKRQTLHKISEERMAHWPNTIEAQRLKKEQARKERLEKEEMRRLAIDQEEQELQVAKKENAIRKANLQLYEENDRIKNFTSKLFLATVLDEREKQIAIKQERDEQNRQAEMQWGIIEQEHLRKAEEEEAAKIKNSKARMHKMKDTQLEQLEEIRQRKLAERAADREEGEKMKRLAMEAIAEERAEEERKIVQQKKRSKEFVEANDEAKHYREERLRAEKEENARIAEFASLKEKQMEDRKRRVDEKFSTKLLHRQELIDRQAHALAEMKAAQEEREMRAMRDFDKERREREAREQAYRDRRQKEIDEHRQYQLSLRQLNKKKDESEKARMQEVWRQRADLLINEELDERQEARDKAETLQRIHMLQMHEKEQQRAAEKKSEIIEGLNLQKALQDEQEVYHNYVNAVMGEYVRHGRDADIVKRASSKAKGIKKNDLDKH